MAFPTPNPRGYPTSRSQRIRAGEAWELTLEQWQAVWRAGGDYSLRGAGRGCYRMLRVDDSLPWRADNVRIHYNAPPVIAPAPAVEREYVSHRAGVRVLSVRQWIAELREAQHAR